MKLKVSYLIGEERKVVLIKDKRIKNRADVERIERMIERKIGKEGVKVISWKIVGTEQERMTRNGPNR